MAKTVYEREIGFAARVFRHATINLYPVYRRLFIGGFRLRYSFTLRLKTYRPVADPEASPLHSIAAREQKDHWCPGYQLITRVWTFYNS